MPQRRRTAPDVRRAIQDLAAEGHTAISIQALLEQDERFAGRVPVSQRTVQSIAREGRLRDASGRWSLKTAGEDAVLVLPVFRAILERWHGSMRLTNAQAAWVARLRAADPELPALEAFRLAQRYLAAEQLGKTTTDEDRFIALQLWRDDKKAREAFRSGLVNTIRGDLLEKGVDY